MLATTALGIAVSSAILGIPAVASADTPGCVSRYEFNRVAKGMTMTKVHRIFDTSGDATGLGAPNEMRYYRPCTRNGMVQVTFSPRDRVVSKSANWFG